MRLLTDDLIGEIATKAGAKYARGGAHDPQELAQEAALALCELRAKKGEKPPPHHNDAWTWAWVYAARAALSQARKYETPLSASRNFRKQAKEAVRAQTPAEDCAEELFCEPSHSPRKTVSEALARILGDKPRREELLAVAVLSGLTNGHTNHLAQRNGIHPLTLQQAIERIVSSLRDDHAAKQAWEED
jgi:hypothetical protein